MAETTVSPEAFHLDGGAVGCLLLHGLTGSPPEVRPVGDYLHGKGVTVTAPLLPGHGTQPEALLRVRWEDWFAAADAELRALQERCEVVFVGGLSMGALLAVHLAARYPELAGLLLYSPALRLNSPVAPLLPLLRHLITWVPPQQEQRADLTDPDAPSRLWHYTHVPVAAVAELVRLQGVVRAELPRVRVPALVLSAVGDATLHPSAGRRTFAGLGATDKELVILHRSGHCLTVDSERDAVMARSYGFVVAHAGGRL
jgi:carboxylesterase